jgi:alkanesulfonate monooxygenase SsuD/methylene tetrahydromethanopterin reductase-like flavin-dependent oxidoreductase (luciferase family)
MHLSIVAATSHIEPLLPLSQAAEEAGLYRVWTTEGAGGDALIRAMHIASGTRSIRIGTGIAFAFTRPPLAMAAAAADVQETSGGRFALGIGAGTRGIRERRYGVTSAFDHPGPRISEYAELVRAALLAPAGISHHGRFYQVQYPNFKQLHTAKLMSDLQIYGASLHPIMTRYMAASCDGVALHSLGILQPYFEDHLVPALKSGAERAGHYPRVAAWIITAVNDDEEEARQACRRQLAFYFSTPSYASLLDGHEWADAAEQIRLEAKDRQYSGWDVIGRLVPEKMIDGLAIAATPMTFKVKLARLADRLSAGGVDELALQLIGDQDAQQALRDGLNIVQQCKNYIGS